MADECFPTHLSQQVGVEDLEHFVETKLAQSLHGVSDESWGPPLAQSSHPLLPYGHLETIEHVLVLGRVNLGEREEGEEEQKIWKGD